MIFLIVCFCQAMLCRESLFKITGRYQSILKNGSLKICHSKWGKNLQNAANGCFWSIKYFITRKNRPGNMSKIHSIMSNWHSTTLFPTWNNIVQCILLIQNIIHFPTQKMYLNPYWCSDNSITWLKWSYPPQNSSYFLRETAYIAWLKKQNTHTQ